MPPSSRKATSHAPPDKTTLTSVTPRAPGSADLGVNFTERGHIGVSLIEQGSRCLSPDNGPKPSPYRPELLSILYILFTINNGVLDVESLVIEFSRGRVLLTVHDLKVRLLGGQDMPELLRQPPW
jgi:hypothetical protein